MTQKPQGHRLRTGRVSETGRIYLITAVCHERRRHFGSLARGRCVVRSLQAAQSQALTLCYVVMPDHVHWLAQLSENANLSASVQKVKSLTTKALCRDCQVDRPVWQRGFHDRAVRREEDLQAMARYVVANPLRAGIADSLRRYALWDAVWV